MTTPQSPTPSVQYPLTNDAVDTVATTHDTVETANRSANLPALIPQPGGRGALYAGGVPGNRGGFTRPDWFKRRMAAALRAGKGAEVVQRVMSGDILEQIGTTPTGKPIYGKTRNADRLRAVDLAAELADLKPRKDDQGPLEASQPTGEQRLAALLDALPMALKLVDASQRERITQALEHIATSNTPTP